MRKDWINVWWQAAMLPDQWEVAGVKRLPSLSVWHVFALENIGNHYLAGGPCDRDDAAGLLLFASNDYRAGRRMIFDPARRARLVLKMFKRIRNVPLPDLHAACEEYAATCTRGASRFKSESGKPWRVPFCWHLVSFLSGGLASEMETAWNTSYAQGKALFDAWAERQGDTSILSSQAQEMEDNWDDYKDKQGVDKIELEDIDKVEIE